MIVLQVRIVVKAGQLPEFNEASKSDAYMSMVTEPGCLGFEIWRDLANPYVMYYHERYRDQAALDAHKQTEHFKAWHLFAEDATTDIVIQQYDVEEI